MNVAPPGRLVNGLHIWAEGEGRPLVVLEAGIAASSVSWSLVQARIAEFARVLSYDRAGFGWSAARPRSGTALEAAHALGRLLEIAGEQPPFVLVGHSFGGLIVRIFQQQFPDKVAGLVLVDPVIRSEWRERTDARRRLLRRGVVLSRRGAWLARIGIVGIALKLLTSGSHRLPQFMARVSAGRASGITDQLTSEVRKIPREYWPAIAQHWSQARSFLAMAANLESLPVSVTQIDEDRPLDGLPVTVLSACSPGSAGDAEHRHDAALSSRGEHIAVPDCGHWVQLDAPGTVVEAIRRVVLQSRQQVRAQ